MISRIRAWYRSYRDTLEFNRGFDSTRKLLVEAPDEEHRKAVCLILSAIITLGDSPYFEGARLAFNQYSTFEKELHHEN